MTREEILKVAKPILFNTEMVRAILDGRKTATRRVIKPQPIHIGGFWELGGAEWSDSIKTVHPVPCHSLYNRMPYRPGDILYVRETWYSMPGELFGDLSAETVYFYKADGDFRPISRRGNWRPSIHMPKEAARIFLRVTDVRVERLREITNESAIKEGFEGVPCTCQGYPCTDCMGTGWIEPPKVDYMYFWDTTIKKSDLDRYDWDANPWVWVVEFERVRAE